MRINYALTACKEIEVLVMAEMSDAVSAWYNIRGNSPAYSDKALTQNGASTPPRKPAKIEQNEITSLIIYIATVTDDDY